MTIAEQLSEALLHKLEQQLVLAKELVHVDEELAAMTLDVFENPVGAAQWLTSEQPILGTKLTPMEYSRTAEGKTACIQALGRLDHGIFG